MSHMVRHVHKFGGSSLADASCFRRVAQIIGQYTAQGDLIVVSAAGKTTNRLLDLIALSHSQGEQLEQVADGLFKFQGELIHELLDAPLPLVEALDADYQQLQILLTQTSDPYVRTEILSFGERWSARLLSALLKQNGLASDWLDSRDFLRAPSGLQPQVDTQTSQPLLMALLANDSMTKRLVVTGFIARDEQGHTITLGRNGSDYSATEIAALANAASTTIWSDVAGIYSADPRKVREAALLNKLSLNEARELSRIGASVLHVRSLEPLNRSKQKLTLRSSYTPDEGATEILRHSQGGRGARIISSLDNVCLVDVQFDGKAQHCSQLIAALHQQQLPPLTWQQRRDCHLIRLAFTREFYMNALAAIHQWAGAHSFSVQGHEGYCLLAIVGRKVQEVDAHSQAFYQLLSHQPVTFVQQGDEQSSLIAILPQITLDPLLNELHQALFSQPRRIGLMVFGKGNIGEQWLELFADQREILEQKLHQRIVLAGLFSSRGGMVDFHGLDPATVLSQFSPKEVIWSELLERLAEHPFDELIAIDMTASETISRYYPQVAELGVHLVTANKHAGSAPEKFYQQVVQQFHDHGAKWLYNATVGAGLPVQSSIQMLRHAGDQIIAISGIFSGTLSWLFQQFDGTRPFSSLLKQAWEQGLCEPDPREDLSGQDVARKLLILTREAGFSLEHAEIDLQSLVPKELTAGSVEAFLEQLTGLDEWMDEQFKRAKANGEVIRYVAHFSPQEGAQVGLQRFAQQHPFANLRPGDNIFAIHSQWYRHNPLIIQGPGAGREVTAGAIQSDLVTLCQWLA